MESTSSSGIKIEEESLLLSYSSIYGLRSNLKQLEKRLEKETPSELMNDAMQLKIEPLIKTLSLLLRHHDTEVNISAACCICEVFRIMVYKTPYDDEQMKDIFQLLVTTFEKLSSASDGCYEKMVKVLITLDIGKFSLMMCDLELDELIVRLFKQFLTFADSNSPAVVVHMKQIIVTIIQKTEPVNHILVDLLVTSVGKENKISSPVCWQLGRDVLITCVAQLRPHLPEKVAGEVFDPLMEIIPSTTSASKLGNDAAHKRKSVQPVRRPGVRERKKKRLSNDDPPMPTKSVTEEKGKVLYDGGSEEHLELKPGTWELVKMSSKLSSGDIKLIDAGKSLLILPSSTAQLLKNLKQMEELLQSVELPKGKGKHLQSESMKYAMHPIIEALAAKELLRHPDMDVNISVACCICDVLRTMEGNAAYTNEQMKDFFELAVTTFEKVSSASGECYTNLLKVLKTLSGLSFSVLESDLRLKGLIVRLFKQFLTVADSNSLVVVLEMKNVLTTIIDESEPLDLELVDILVTSARKENQITSPVCWKLGNEVLQKCAAKLKPHLQDKVSKTEGSSLRDTIESGTNTSVLTKNAIQNMQIGCLDESRNRVQPVRRSKDATSDSVDIKKTLSPSMPSTSAIEVLSDDDDDKELIFLEGKKGKLLENASTAPDSVGHAPPLGDIVSVQGYSVKQSIAPILEDIFDQHGDILADCAFQIASVRTVFIEVICEVARTIETSDNTTIISKMEDLESKLSQAAAANINVSWLQDQLKIITRNEALKKTASLKEMKLNTTLAKRAAQADMRIAQADLRIAQEQFSKAESCVKVLELIEEKLGKDINGIKIST